MVEVIKIFAIIMRIEFSINCAPTLRLRLRLVMLMNTVEVEKTKSGYGGVYMTQMQH
jgi:hypothetical protein